MQDCALRLPGCLVEYLHIVVHHHIVVIQHGNILPARDRKAEVQRRRAPFFLTGAEPDPLLQIGRGAGRHARPWHVPVRKGGAPRQATQNPGLFVPPGRASLRSAHLPAGPGYGSKPSKTGRRRLAAGLPAPTGTGEAARRCSRSGLVCFLAPGNIPADLVFRVCCCAGSAISMAAVSLYPKGLK